MAKLRKKKTQVEIEIKSPGGIIINPPISSDAVTHESTTVFGQNGSRIDQPPIDELTGEPEE